MQKFLLKTGIEKFTDAVFPQSQYDACRQVWVRYPDGNFKEICYSKTSKFADKIDKLIISNKFDYYITANSFFANKRGNDSLFGIDNIVIDIDNHNPNIKPYDLAFNIRRLNYLLETKYKDELPIPTIKVTTGRGLQFWFHIVSISSKLLFLYKIVANYFCEVLAKIINEEKIDLEVDYTASTNASGLFRMPFSFNSKNGYYIDSMEVHKKCVYNIDKLIEKYQINKKLKKSSKTSLKNDNKICDEKYKGLHFKRMKAIENYVAKHNFDVVGSRNTIIFLYYNAAVQVMERSKAYERTKKLNQSFNVLYSETEFKTVVNAVKKNVYKISNETFFEMLGFNEEEKDEYIKMSKYKPKVDKEERNKKIKQLATTRMTCDKIAKEVGCSIITVKRVLKNFDKSDFTAIQVKELRKTMSIKKVAELLNISVDTVKRMQKLETGNS